MKRSEEKAVIYCHLLLLLIPIHVHGTHLNNSCNSTRCASDGPVVQFPFRIKGKQPDHCGYPEPGFDLSCSENNRTVLHLTPTWNLTIISINYTSQLISAFDSEGCNWAKILSLNSSGPSPFKFDYQAVVLESYDFSLFNCSSSLNRDSPGLLPVPCLSDAHHLVHAISAEDAVGRHGYLLSCDKITDVAYFPDLLSEQKLLNLTWSSPDCSSCALKGKHCRLKSSGKRPETECYGRDEPGSLTKFIAMGVTLGTILLIGALVMLYRIYSNHRMQKEYNSTIEKFLDDYKSFKPTRFSYAHLKRMTDGFNAELGQGAYGTVYRGKLTNELQVAVKVLNNSYGNGEEFINEVQTIGRIHHVNVVRLVGFCAEGFHRALVYEYLPNGSLQKFISSADSKDHFLGWKRLEEIALGVARGIDYLHQGCEQRILHFDIKPQNILLYHDFNPKVSDFGLAKLCGKDQSFVSMTTAKGTIGYMAPEVFSRNFGSVSYKADVYSFGMLVLEMVGGRKIVDEKEGDDEQIYFPERIYNLLEEGQDLRLEIGEDGDAKIATKLAIVGLWCIQWNPADRPSMKMAIQVLEGEGENLPIPPNPFTATKNPNKRLRQELEAISETE